MKTTTAVITTLLLITGLAICATRFQVLSPFGKILEIRFDDSIYGPDGKLLMDKSGVLKVSQHEFVLILEKAFYATAQAKQ